MLRPGSEHPVVEKRRYPRIAVRLPAVYRSRELTLDAYVSDISQGGLSLTCSEADAEGAAAEVHITLPGQDQNLKLAGEVIWCQHRDGTAVMGICFAEMPREHRLALANFLIARYYSR